MLRFIFVGAVYIFSIMCGQCVVASVDCQPLQFCMYLEVNDEFIYPSTLDPEKVTRSPFMMEINVRGLTDQSLETILRDFLTKHLGVRSIEHLFCNTVQVDEEMGMIHKVQSREASSMASPVESDSRCSFDNFFSPLEESGEKLRSMIEGKIIRVSIQSITDNIYTIGFRLRQKELQEQGAV